MHFSGNHITVLVRCRRRRHFGSNKWSQRRFVNSTSAAAYAAPTPLHRQCSKPRPKCSSYSCDVMIVLVLGAYHDRAARTERVPRASSEGDGRHPPLVEIGGGPVPMRAPKFLDLRLPFWRLVFHSWSSVVDMIQKEALLVMSSWCEWYMWMSERCEKRERREDREWSRQSSKMDGYQRSVYKFYEITDDQIFDQEKEWPNGIRRPQRKNCTTPSVERNSFDNAYRSGSNVL